jgi:hypothetical protein
MATRKETLRLSLWQRGDSGPMHSHSIDGGGSSESLSPTTTSTLPTLSNPDHLTRDVALRRDFGVLVIPPAYGDVPGACV